MKFTYLSYNPSKNFNWTLHAAGCSDIKQELKGIRTDSGFPAEIGETFDAENLEEALNHVIDEEMIEMGYTHDAVKVNPCCHKIK